MGLRAAAARRPDEPAVARHRRCRAMPACTDWPESGPATTATPLRNIRDAPCPTAWPRGPHRSPRTRPLRPEYLRISADILAPAPVVLRADRDGRPAAALRLHRAASAQQRSPPS